VPIKCSKTNTLSKISDQIIKNFVKNENLSINPRSGEGVFLYPTIKAPFFDDSIEARVDFLTYDINFC
jgi:hypothetical protein